MSKHHFTPSLSYSSYHNQGFTLQNRIQLPVQTPSELKTDSRSFALQGKSNRSTLKVRDRRWKTVGFLCFCRWDGWHSQAQPWQYNIKGGFLYSERGQTRLTESGPSIFIHFKSCYSDTNGVNIFSNLFSSCFDQTVPEDSSLLCLCEKYIFRPIFSLRIDSFYSVSLLI